jgi:hypothetical protein
MLPQETAGSALADGELAADLADRDFSTRFNVGFMQLGDDLFGGVAPPPDQARPSSGPISESNIGAI